MSGLQHTMRRWMTILLLLQLDEVDSFIPRPTAVTTSFRPGGCSLSLRTPRRAIDRDSALEEKEEEEAEISPMNYSDTEDGDAENNFTALPMEGIDAVRLDFYARVRAVWTRLVSSITEQLSRGRVWLEEEAMGSIWFLAFLNCSFLAFWRASQPSRRGTSKCSAARSGARRPSSRRRCERRPPPRRSSFGSLSGGSPPASGGRTPRTCRRRRSRRL